MGAQKVWTTQTPIKLSKLLTCVRAEAMHAHVLERNTSVTRDVVVAALLGDNSPSPLAGVERLAVGIHVRALLVVPGITRDGSTGSGTAESSEPAAVGAVCARRYGLTSQLSCELVDLLSTLLLRGEVLQRLLLLCSLLLDIGAERRGEIVGNGGAVTSLGWTTLEGAAGSDGAIVVGCEVAHQRRHGVVLAWMAWVGAGASGEDVEEEDQEENRCGGGCEG